MIDGDRCPECGGRVETDDGLAYECADCERTFDSADLFLP